MNKFKYMYVCMYVCMFVFIFRICHHHHVAIKDLGHLLSHSGLTHPGVYSMVSLGSFCLLVCSFFYQYW
jgi:hypothetical protein